MMTKFDLLGKLKELKKKAKNEQRKARRLAKSGSVVTTA